MVTIKPENGKRNKKKVDIFFLKRMLSCSGLLNLKRILQQFHRNKFLCEGETTLWV